MRSANRGHRFDVIVIGSGIGGLVAGALAGRSGRRVLVLEKNRDFGGAAGVYRSGPLTIEASLHEIDGLDDEDPKLPILRRLGVTDDVELVEVGALYEVRSRLLEEPFVMPAGPREGLAASRERFPADARGLEEYFARLLAVRRALSTAVLNQGDLRSWLKTAPLPPWRFLPVLRSLRLTLGAVLQRLFDEHEAVKLAVAAHLSYYSDDAARLWFPHYCAAQASYHVGGGFYPRGGSQALVESLVSRIRAGGGELEAGRRAIRIVLEDGRVAGVEHEDSLAGDDGRGLRTDWAPLVFGNAAPHVLGEMLPARERGAFMAPYARRPLSASLFTIPLGFDRRPSEFGVRHYSTAVFPDWMRSLGQMPRNPALLADPPTGTMPHFIFVDYSRLDSGLDAKPPFVGMIGGLDAIENWSSLGDAEYRDRRSRWIEALVGALDEQFPGLGGAVVHSEMTTALSNHRYLNTPRGVVYGFAAERRPRFLAPATKIKGLWLASAYTGFGGYTGTIVGGGAAAKQALGESVRDWTT